ELLGLLRVVGGELEVNDFAGHSLLLPVGVASYRRVSRAELIGCAADAPSSSFASASSITTASCVAQTTAVPCSWASRGSSSPTVRALDWSGRAVGPSASRSTGRAAIARAIATR